MLEEFIEDWLIVGAYVALLGSPWSDARRAAEVFLTSLPEERVVRAVKARPDDLARRMAEAGARVVARAGTSVPRRSFGSN